MYIAHTRSDGSVQSIKEHLLNVKALCEDFGSKVDLKYTAGLAGILHDLGKYSTTFQAYLNEIIQFGESKMKNGGDHATAGGLLLKGYCNNKKTESVLVPVINAIFTHHGSLLDIESPDKDKSEFEKRMNKPNDELLEIKKHFFEEVMTEEDLENYIKLVEKEMYTYFKKNISYLMENGFKTTSEIGIFNHISVFLTKFIYSCLLDADRLDSKFFDEGKITTSTIVDWSILQQRLDGKLESFDVKNSIDEMRQQMSDQCFEKAKKETGIYSLSVPTGGGKTLASLRFGIEHLRTFNKKRIIYIVPFTTIIEQNVKEVEKILWRAGEPNFILEHHSNVLNDEEGNWKNEKKRKEYEKSAKNYVDNWDSPIIFTTLVQYLNVFFDAKNRNTRRLHNLLNSVIIFDEIQSLPLQSTKLFNESIDYLSSFGNTTILLCTATQPALENITKHAKKPVELIDNIDEVITKFSRTKINYLEQNGGFNTEELKDLVVEKVNEENSVLVIVNTKLAARKLKQELDSFKDDDQILIYHLSTSMCPEHRREVLNLIRKNLTRNNKKIICISTQLIEAGVDISFNCVIRSLAGLSSIAQAAGRCNRNGLTRIKNVYVIKHNEENLSRLKEIADGGRIAEGILKDCKDSDENPLSQKMMNLYFEKLYKLYDNQLYYPFGNTSLYNLFFKGFKEKGNYFYSNSIGTASKEFNVISNESEALLVPFESGDAIGMSGKDLINILLDDQEINDFTMLMKNAQKYSINIFPYERRLLEAIGAITVVTFGKRSIYVLNDNSYSEEYGLDIDKNNSMGIIY